MRITARFFISNVFFLIGLGETPFATANPLASECPSSAISDSEFINAGTDVVRRVFNYTPENAERKFQSAISLFDEASRAKFQSEFIDRELPRILKAKRVEDFIFNRRAIKFDRFDDRGIGIVRIDGVRNRQVDNKSVSSQHTEIQVILKPDCTKSEVNPSVRVVDLELPKEEFESVSPRRRNGQDDRSFDASEQYGDLFLAFQRDITRSKKEISTLSEALRRLEAESNASRKQVQELSLELQNLRREFDSRKK